MQSELEVIREKLLFLTQYLGELSELRELTYKEYMKKNIKTLLTTASNNAFTKGVSVVDREYLENYGVDCAMKTFISSIISRNSRTVDSITLPSPSLRCLCNGKVETSLWCVALSYLKISRFSGSMY